MGLTLFGVTFLCLWMVELLSLQDRDDDLSPIPSLVGVLSCYLSSMIGS